jgi:two-component system phosphate regulon sensor histidine kinase PhoR
MLREVARVVLFGIISALVLALVLSTLITTQITGPLDKIIQASKRFASGDFGHKIYHDSRDEIGELADTLNKIAADIEEKIRATVNQSQQLKAIFNSMIEGVILTEASGRIISVNQAIERIFQIVKEGAQGRPLMEAIRNNEIAEVVASVLKSGKQVSKEISLVYPVQGVFEVNASPIFYGKEISGCLAVIHDITGIRRLETMRRDFVANVSHELKTPLTSIKGFVETLLAGALEDKENNRNFLKIIEGHAERLDHLVNDLLSLSYLESKGITISKESYDLTAQARDVALGFKSQLKKKGIIIANKMPDGLTVCADRARIEQVLVNLLDNAIKFNREKGTIVLRAEDTGSQVKVEIEDSGLGIPARDLARIFERFYRVDKARSRELGGTGLGLSIVKHIVELHGGSVGVESTEGLGSKFRFILPK